MGGRYADVVAAVNGNAWFGAGPTGPIPSPVNSAPAAAIGGPATPRGDTLVAMNPDATTVASNPYLANPGPVAGRKRKRPTIDLGVVDLTGGDTS